MTEDEAKKKMCPVLPIAYAPNNEAIMTPCDCFAGAGHGGARQTIQLRRLELHDVDRHLLRLQQMAYSLNHQQGEDHGSVQER